MLEQVEYTWLAKSLAVLGAAEGVAAIVPGEHDGNACAWQAEASTMEQLMAKRAQLQAKKSDFEKRIRELGSLPGDAFEKFRDAQPKELHKQLTRTNTQLKQYR